MKKTTELNFAELVDELDTAVKTLDCGYTPEQWENGAYVYLKRFENAEKLKYELYDRIDHENFDGWEDAADWDDIYERLNEWIERTDQHLTKEEYDDEAELMAWDEVETQVEELCRRLEVEEHQYSWECSFDRDNPYEVEEWFEQQFKELEDDDE